MNRLKESHIPEVLIKELTATNPKITTTQEVTKNVQGIIQNDPALFDLEIIPNKKRENSLIASCPAVHLIAPGSGQMGFCMEPADDSSEGRIILPMFVASNLGLRYLQVDCLSDFRWDTCMISAGADWVTSDTFVAGFARCRWDYRNKSKEVREKALIFKDENDKRNWRRLYRLYENSAHEGGKLLYYKNRMVYRACVPYLVMPQGVERIKE